MKALITAVCMTVAAFVVVGCGGNDSPLSPSSTNVSSTGPLRVSIRSLSGSPYFPPIAPEGISCPNDAPQLRVSSVDTRVDLEFSEVAGASKYEVAIFIHGASNAYEFLERRYVDAPANRYEWYGVAGARYLIKVRTVNCGGLGLWADGIVSIAGDAVTASPSQPTEGGDDNEQGGGGANYISYWTMSGPSNIKAKQKTCENHDGVWLGSYDIPGDGVNGLRPNVCGVVSASTDAKSVSPTGNAHDLYTPPGFVLQ